VSRNEKLFRAIVVMGAAMTTAPGCDVDKDCGKCLPIDAAVVADGRIVDGGVDAPTTPGDAVVDSVIITI
jgi:hypothetical protein